MEKVRILGVDASLRNTGLAIVSYNTELPISHPEAFKTEACQVLENPEKYKGTDAILNMLDMMMETMEHECYQTVDTVIVESPPVMFNKNWSGGTIASIAHISGGAVVAYGISKSYLFRPNEWNKTRKKEVTHSQTVSFLGDWNGWDYKKRVKNEKKMEHILDAASMALWWIKSNYVDE